MNQTGSGATTNNAYATIHKTAVQANMADYQALYASFDWTDFAGELGVKPDAPVNKATVCIDRHSPEVMARPALLWESAPKDGKKTEKLTYTFADL